MVVGPEYGAILSLAFGVTRRDSSRVLRSAAALVIGFTLAVAGALLLSLILRWAGLEPRAYALGIRPVSNLINTPDWFSFIVATLAGVVGVVSLTEARSSTLIGVFISLTTIPAASDIGVSLAFGSGSEAWGSTLQLLLNVTVLAAVAIAGLPAQRAIWRHIARRATRLGTPAHRHRLAGQPRSRSCDGALRGGSPGHRSTTSSRGLGGTQEDESVAGLGGGLAGGCYRGQGAVRADEEQQITAGRDVGVGGRSGGAGAGVVAQGEVVAGEAGGEQALPPV
jgi:uncharacterized hydrophobic protein (TIGR00271 family)